MRKYGFQQQSSWLESIRIKMEVIGGTQSLETRNYHEGRNLLLRRKINHIVSSTQCEGG